MNIKKIFSRNNDRMVYATFLGGHPKLKGSIGFPFGVKINNGIFHIITGIVKDVYAPVDEVDIKIVDRKHIDDSLYEVMAEDSNLEIRYKAYDRKKGNLQKYIIYLGGSNIEKIYQSYLKELEFKLYN